jgi:hypothetical protein
MISYYFIVGVVLLTVVLALRAEEKQRKVEGYEKNKIRRYVYDKIDSSLIDDAVLLRVYLGTYADMHIRCGTMEQYRCFMEILFEKYNYTYKRLTQDLTDEQIIDVARRYRLLMNHYYKIVRPVVYYEEFLEEN